MMKQKAMIGAGCFWGVAEILRKIEGIVNVEVGYAGGSVNNPSYEMVCSGTTGHAEVVMIEFDAEKIAYEEVLNVFFRLHDPTTLNRQHNDIGTQYRSVIFTFNEEQKLAAVNVICQLEAQKVFTKKIVTEIVPYSNYFKAENYHQDYLIKNPSGYMCHILRD